jgi:leader peptidase (prepilin peptidase) / N-methyltransferase
MDLFTSETARWFFAAWFLFLGGAVGSFLNVVVYRLPAGMSIAWPGSHCPRCKRPIRSFDNVPVLAWLWLRGRCRDCREPISARYPTVEALVAILFLLLLIVEVFHGGHNLPVRIARANGGHAYSPAQALSLCLLHLGLLCTLLGSALMTWDGKRPPWRLFLPMLLVGYFAPIVWPWLHPSATGPGMPGYPWDGIIDSTFSLASGYIFGRAAQWLGRRFAGMGRPGYQIPGEAMLLGVVLGWQAALVLVLAAMALEELTRLALLRRTTESTGRVATGRLSAAIWLPLLALLWILNWASLATFLRLGS